MTFFTGDYDDFVDRKTTGRRQTEADIAQKKKRIAELKEFVARFGASANRSSQAQSRQKEIDKLQAGIVTKRSSVVRPYIKFEMGKPSGRDVLRAEGLVKTFGPKTVFKNFSMNLNRGDKLAVIGPSGVGKSTLLKMLVGEYTPDGGKVIWGHDTNVGYFAQDHHEALEPGFTCYEWLHRFDKDAPVEHVRSILGRLLSAVIKGSKDRGTLGRRSRALAVGEADPAEEQWHL
ncbi:MAG: ATP-binding cassette domain-containing protein [Polyangiaceae bacterium]